jgi:hypothetical protein
VVTLAPLQVDPAYNIKGGRSAAFDIGGLMQPQFLRFAPDL